RLRAAPETELLGNSSAGNHLRQAIAKVAPTGSRVLITGAAGSGKEVVARLIHLQSRRSNGPFMVLNCATLHPDRLEQELFGVEQGGGAQSRIEKIGIFERAHEIGRAHV